MRKTGSGLGIVLGIIALGCGGSGHRSEVRYGESIARLKILNAALLLYSADYDDILPLGNWMDGIDPYVTDKAAFRSPAVEKKGYGYALNAAIVGQSLMLFTDRDTVLSIFDSTALTRNAVASIGSIPTPARYGSKNTLGYLDGHVQDGDTPADQATIARNRLRQVALGMQIYTTDYDDRLPLANKWMDQLSPYVTSQSSFRSPAVQAVDSTAFGFALNSDLAGASLVDIESPAFTPLVFDSTILTRNATAPISTMPAPARYPTGNTIAYADTHVKP